MVDLRKTIILLAVTIFALEASAQSTLGTFAERQTKQLERRKELIAQQLSAATEAFEATPGDSLGMIVHELTKQREAIDNALVIIATQEQERLLKEQEEAEAEAECAAPIVADTTAVGSDVVAPEVPATAPIVTPPAEEKPSPLNRFSAALSSYALVESEIGLLIENYKNAYHKASDALLAYGGATNLAKATELYNAYNEAVETMNTLANDIALRSQELFRSKIDTYISIAKEINANHIEAKYEKAIQHIDSKHVPELKGRCTNIDLAMYPHRLRSTIELEIELAELLGCESAAPLKEELQEYNTSYTRFAKLKAPAYAQTEYKALAFDKKKVYVPVSSLPKIEVPSKGEVFSIEVAGYSKLPTSTSVFHNATPLFSETRSDGRTYIYVGLYPTAKSTTDDIALMRSAGFKNPVVVAWRDGIRRDNVAQSGSANFIYRIEINGVDSALTPDVLQVIRQSGKETSRYLAADGSLIYLVSSFAKEEDARKMAASITAADTSLAVTIIEVERKK